MYAEQGGGPLDGQLLDVTGWSAQQLLDGALLICESERDVRAGWAQRLRGPGEAGRLYWQGDMPRPLTGRRRGFAGSRWPLPGVSRRR
ncbi:hypothetical protein [Streptomyces globisporus]|uniref:hypothetical protein n=1 Tax=Streptomyces globisporus TaxID=1908 RepID=UPI0037B3C923